MVPTDLKIDRPCPYSMSRLKKGDRYYCNSCSKTISDYRDMSIEEIKSVITKDSCGIFNLDQLKGQQKMPLSRQILFYSLTLISFLGFDVKPIKAQNTAPKKESISVDPILKDDNNEPLNKGQQIENKKDTTEFKKKKKTPVFRRKKKKINKCHVLGAINF